MTTTRNPFDFYVAEYERTRRRWVQTVRKPDSWVHATPGAVGRIVDAVTLEFNEWLLEPSLSPARAGSIAATWKRPTSCCGWSTSSPTCVNSWASRSPSPPRT